MVDALEHLAHHCRGDERPECPIWMTWRALAFEEMRQPAEPGSFGALEATQVELPIMPRSLFRILAAALLAIAVPIQGMAAVKAGLCMALGGHGGEQTHAAAASHDHGAGTPAHDHGQAPPEDQPASNAHCPPCASCCATAAIAPTTTIALPDARPATAIAALQYWIPGVLPDQLDRPPLAL